MRQENKITVRNNITPHQQKAYQLLTDLQSAIKEQARLFLVLGKLLKEIRDGKFYQYMGDGGYESWNYFLNNPEIGLRPSTAYLYIRIYEYYIEKLQMSEQEVIQIPLNRLMRILPKLKEMKDDQAREVVSGIGQMTTHDFDAEVKEQGWDFDKPSIYIHKDCGKFIIQFHEKDICSCDGLAIRDLDIIERNSA